ncbi:auxin-induced protein 5ng4-like, partial [Trifolium pratense]
MTMALGFFYYGLRDTSATYSVNFLNMIPIFTFLTSIVCRMESVRIGTWGGKAKCIGAFLCVGGALVTGLYKGKEFYISHHHAHHSAQRNVVAAHKTNMLRGTLFLIASCFSYTSWFILQGAIATAATFCLLSWAITIKGPTYPPMFNPLALVFVAISAAIILGEPLKVGTLIGMVLIILGLYFFLWGKKNEIPRLPQTNVAAGELSTSITTDDSFQAQST